MVVIVTMLSAPRYVFGICAVGGAPHVVTRSPTSVWTHPRPRGRLCMHVSNKNTLNKPRVHVSHVRCWVLHEEHFWLCGEHWPPCMLAFNINSSLPSLTNFGCCGVAAPFETRRATTGKTMLPPRCVCRKASNTPVLARSSERPIVGAWYAFRTAAARSLPKPFL